MTEYNPDISSCDSEAHTVRSEEVVFPGYDDLGKYLIRLHWDVENVVATCGRCMVPC